MMEHLQTVQQIFADKLFIVPDYQRGYAWEKNNWEDLIDDLEVLYEDKEHYTGTLVLHLDEDRGIVDEGGRTLDIYDVVDGQQRLTTIIILLHCISKELKKYNSKLAEGIRKNYIKIVDIENQEKARLSLNKDCHDFFVNNIISEEHSIKGPDIKSHQRLEQAMNFFSEYLNDMKKKSLQNYDSLIMDLHKKITNCLKFTVYEVPNTSEVGVIFEVMNNRGKPLSEMEKVKNYMLYLSSKIDMEAATDLEEKINKVWASIFKRLMESDLSSIDSENQLLRTTWIMAYDYNYRQWHGYSSIKNRFNLKEYRGKNDKLLEGLERYVEILHQSCIAYCDILAPNSNYAFNNFSDKLDARKRLRKKAEKLEQIGNRVPFLPLLMVARIKYADDYKFLESLLEISEKYAFRIYRIQRNRSNTGQSNLFKQGFNLFRGRVSRKFVLRKIQRTLLYYSPEDSYRSFFSEIGKNWYNFYGLKYFLYEYENEISRGKGVQLPWDYLVKKDKKESIEHILPQSPDRVYWKKRWSEEEIETYMHDIGNLTLTFDNSVYSNKSFPEKKGNPGEKNCYITSNLFQEKDLGVYEDWTTKELKERRKKIISWAIERWGVEGEYGGDFAVYEEDEEIEAEETEDLINGLNEEEDISDVELKEEKEDWTRAEIYEYLDYLKEYGEYTYFYYKVLSSVKDKIGYDEVKERIKNISPSGFSGKKFAGVLSGLTRKSQHKGGERLDNISDEGWTFSLNKKYSEIIRNYFKEVDEDK